MLSSGAMEVKGVPGRFLPALAASFLDHLRLERGLSPNTLAAYEADCRSFLASLPGEVLREAGRLREKHVFDFVVGERKRGRGVTSVRRSLSALRIGNSGIARIFAIVVSTS